MEVVYALDPASKCTYKLVKRHNNNRAKQNHLPGVYRTTPTQSALNNISVFVRRRDNVAEF